MMRFDSIKALVQVDLLQSNRQTNTNAQAKKLKKSNIYRRLLIQNVAIILIFGLLFGSVLFNIPLAEYPGIFTQTMHFMILFSLLQLFQLVYNLFYDEGDLSAQLSLPFTVTELFFSKFISVIMTSFAYFMSPFILITILGTQTNHSILLSLVIGFFSSFLIMLVAILSIFIGLDLLHRSSLFKKHRRMILLVLYITLFGFVLYSLYGNDSGGAAYGIEVIDAKIVPLFIGFHEILIPGVQLSGWIKIGLWAILGLVLIFVMYKWIVPQLYSEDKSSEQKSKKPKKVSSASLSENSKWKVFFKYQLRQLQDTSLVLQMLFSKFYLPFIMLAPVLFSDNPVDLSILNEIPHLWGAYLLVGASLGLVMISETTISGVIISFDKENYYYIQSLPISFQGYLKIKFYFAFFIEWLISAVVIIGLAFYLKIPIFTLIFLLIGYTVGTYLGSLYYYIRDYRLLDLNWKSFNELMQRGLSQGLRILIQLAVLAFGIFILFGVLFWFALLTTDLTRIIISFGMLLLFIILIFGINKYAQTKFWNQFNL